MRAPCSNCQGCGLHTRKLPQSYTITKAAENGGASCSSMGPQGLQRRPIRAPYSKLPGTLVCMRRSYCTQSPQSRRRRRMVAPRVCLVMGPQGLAGGPQCQPIVVNCGDLGLHAAQAASIMHNHAGGGEWWRLVFVSDGASRACSGDQCVVHCEGSWSTCDASCTQSYTITKAAENGGAVFFSVGLRTALVAAPLHMCHRHLMFLSLTFTSTRDLQESKLNLSHCLTAQGRTDNVTRRNLANVEGGETLTLRGRGQRSPHLPLQVQNSTAFCQLCSNMQPHWRLFYASTRVADDKMSLRLSVPSYSDLCADRDGRPACVENGMYLALHNHAPSSWQVVTVSKWLLKLRQCNDTDEASCGGGNFRCPAAEEGGALYLLRDSCAESRQMTIQSASIQTQQNPVVSCSQQKL